MSKHDYCNVATFLGTNVLSMQKASETLWKDFGAWIKRRREDLRFSQAEAAKKAGIDRQQWYRIESGKSGTKRDTVIAMANAVSIDVKEALERAGYAGSPKKPENINELILQLQNLGIVDQIEFDEHDPRWQEMDFEDLKDDITLIIERTIRKRNK